MADYNLGTASGRIVVDGSMAEKGFSVAQQAAASFFDQVETRTSEIEQLGKQLRTTSAVGVAGFGVAVKAASGFEARLSAIQAVSGATTDEMARIGDAALDIGAKTSFSATEAASAFEELIKAGISTEDALNGAAAATVAMAEAGEIALPRAAEIASAAMNNFNLSGKDMPKIADVVAGAANASAISVEDFAQSMNQAGSVANLTGMSFEDMAVAIAEMGNVGIKGSDAGTSLKTMLMNLIPKTKEQVEKFKELGLMTYDSSKAMTSLAKQGIKPASKSFGDVRNAAMAYVSKQENLKVGTKALEKATDEWLIKNGAMQNAFFTSEGEVKKLADIQEVLQKSTGNLTKEQKLQALETMFGADAIRAAAVMAENGAEGYNELATAIGGVTAADVAGKRLDNLSGDVEAFKGSVETLAIRIGTALLPAVRYLVQGATAVVDWVNQASDGFITWTTRIVAAATAAGGLAGAIIGFLSGAGPMLSTLVALSTAVGIFKGIGAGLKAILAGKGIMQGLALAMGTAGKQSLILRTASLLLRSALSALGLGAVTAAVKTFAGALIAGQNPIRATRTLVTSLGIAYQVAAARATFFAKVLRIVGAAVAFMTGPIGITIAVIGALVAAAIWAYQNFEPFREIVNQVAQTIMTFLAPAIEEVEKSIAKFIRGMKGAGTAVGGLQGFANMAGQGVKALIDAFTSGQASGDGFLGAMSSLGAGVASFVGLLQQLGAQIWAAMGAAWTQIVSVWQTSVVPALAQLWTALQNLWTVIQTQIVPVLTTLWTNLGPIIMAIGQLVGAIVGGLIVALVAVAGFVIGTVLPALLQLSAWFITTLLPVISQVASWVMQYLLTPLLQFVTWLTTVLGPAIQFLSQVFQVVFPIIADIVMSTIQQIMAIFQGIVTFITGIINVIAGIFTGDWNRIWTGLGQIVQGAFQAIWNFILVFLLGKILKVFGVFFNFLKPLFSGGFNAVKGIVTTVFNAIRGFIQGAIGFIRGIISTGMNFIRAVWQRVWNGIVTIVTGVVGRVRGTVSGWINGIRALIQTGINAAAAIWSAVWNRIVATVSGIVGRVVSTVSGLISSVRNLFSGAVNWLVQAGRDIINGLINGIKGMVGAAIDAAKGVGESIMNGVKNILGIQSPSKEMKKLGKYIVQGLAIGITATRKQAVAAIEKVAKEITKVAKKEGKNAKAALDILSDQKKLTKGKDKTLADFVQTREGLVKKLEKLKERGDAALQLRDSIKDKLADEFKIGDLTQLAESQGVPLTFNDIKATAQATLGRIQAFGKKLKDMAQANVHPALINEIAALGTVQGSLAADAVLSGGKSGVASLNKLYKSIQSSSKAAGTTVASEMYSIGKNSVLGLIDGLESEKKKLDQTIKGITDRMVKLTKKKLDINSPSGIYDREVGRQLPAGIEKGIEHGLPSLMRTIASMGIPGKDVFGGLPAASAPAPAAAQAVTSNQYTIHLHDVRTDDPQAVAGMVVSEIKRLQRGGKYAGV